MVKNDNMFGTPHLLKEYEILLCFYHFHGTSCLFYEQNHVLLIILVNPLEYLVYYSVLD